MALWTTACAWASAPTTCSVQVSGYVHLHAQKRTLVPALVPSGCCVQERLFLGPVVKKEFHFQPRNANQALSANLGCICEWDAANFKVLYSCAACSCAAVLYPAAAT